MLLEINEKINEEITILPQRRGKRLFVAECNQRF